MGHPPFGNREQMMEKLKVPKPKNLREVPGYLHKVFGGFFKRLFYIFRLVWEAKPWILFVMVFHALFHGVAPVISAYISADLLNALGEAIKGIAGVGNTVEWSTILLPLVYQCAFLFLMSLESILYSTLTQLAGEIVSNSIKLKIIEKAKAVDLASYDMPEFYEKMENASREAGTRPINLLRDAFSIVSYLISVISFIIIIVNLSPWAPIIMALLAIPTAVINFIYSKKMWRYSRMHSLERRQMNYYSDVMVDKDLVKELRIYGLYDTFTDRFKYAFQQYYRGLKKIILGQSAWRLGISGARQVVHCFLFLFVANQVYIGSLQIGDYSLYSGALSNIENLINDIVSLVAGIYEGTLFINNMIDFMDEKPTILPILDEPLHLKRHVAHCFEFKDVCFHYPGSDHMVIDHINLRIEPGDTVVLVGLNGAGKTTLIKLLTRLYDPTEGVIFLDGEDIRKYDTRDLYEAFGIIFQDFGKYAVSVEENISFGQVDKPIKRDEIVLAAQQSDADTFIRRLPKGYETPLMRYFSSEGRELSIGQWQKLAIARAFYSESDIMILDEPTASLDALAEQEIFNQFDELRKDKTTIFVSHRLSSATTADKIVVLEHGKLEETGTHKELMEKKGRYYEMFTTQASRYLGELKEKEAPDFPPFGSEGFPPPPFPPRMQKK